MRERAKHEREGYVRERELSMREKAMCETESYTNATRPQTRSKCEGK